MRVNRKWLSIGLTVSISLMATQLLTGCHIVTQLENIKYEKDFSKIKIGNSYQDMIDGMGIPEYNGGRTTCYTSEYGETCYHRYTTNYRKITIVTKDDVITGWSER